MLKQGCFIQECFVGVKFNTTGETLTTKNTYFDPKVDEDYNYGVIKKDDKKQIMSDQLKPLNDLQTLRLQVVKERKEASKFFIADSAKEFHKNPNQKYKLAKKVEICFDEIFN